MVAVVMVMVIMAVVIMAVVMMAVLVQVAAQRLSYAFFSMPPNWRASVRIAIPRAM